MRAVRAWCQILRGCSGFVGGIWAWRYAGSTWNLPTPIGYSVTICTSMAALKGQYTALPPREATAAMTREAEPIYHI